MTVKGTAAAGGLGAEQLRQLLEAGISPVLGRVRIVDLEPLKGGYSRQMWSFDAVSAGGERHPLIYCADSIASVVGDGDQSLSRPTEAALLHALHRSGLPVPDALWSGGAESVFGRPFLVMQRCSGMTAVGPLHRDPWYLSRRARLGTQLASTLAAIHATNVPVEILGRPPAADEVAAREQARWTAELRSTPRACSAALRRGLDWLGAHRPPPPQRVTLVHGDYRTGNILHGHDDGGDEPDGLRTVLDWEMAHYGDPLEDVAWAQLVCWRVGTDRVGGLVELDRWPGLYTEAAGQEIDPQALRWWEILCSVKISCLMRRAAAAVTASAEQALLDRLFAEVDAELDRRLLADDD